MSLKFACFITGTDTEIGKTLIASALLHSLTQQNMKAIGMKPVAAGTSQINGHLSNEDIEQLTAAGNLLMPRSLTTPYLLHEPAAPHLAARLDGVTMSLAHIVDCYDQLATKAEAIVVEGVGGFCVPLADDFDTADLAKRLDLPVILVVGMRLGCLNHALLTAEAIASRSLKIAGWVANLIPPEMPHAQSNIETLQQRIDAPLIGVVAGMATPTAAGAAAFLKPHRMASWPSGASSMD